MKLGDNFTLQTSQMRQRSTVKLNVMAEFQLHRELGYMTFGHCPVHLSIYSCGKGVTHQRGVAERAGRLVVVLTHVIAELERVSGRTGNWLGGCAYSRRTHCTLHVHSSIRQMLFLTFTNMIDLYNTRNISYHHTSLIL